MKTWLYIALGLWALAEVLQRVFTPKRAAQNIANLAAKLYSGPHEHAQVKASDFKGLNHAYYDRTQAELESHGFRCLGDFENVTLSRALPHMRTFLRRLVGEEGTTMAAIYQVKHGGIWMRLLSMCGRLTKDPSYVDFETEFTDGTFLATSNTEGSKTSAVPGIIGQRQPRATTPGELLALHRQKLAELTAQGLSPVGVNSAAESQASQDRMQEIKNQHRKKSGYVDMEQVRALAEAKASAETSEALLTELAAIQRQSQPSTSSSTPPPLPQQPAVD